MEDKNSVKREIRAGGTLFYCIVFIYFLKIEPYNCIPYFKIDEKFKEKQGAGFVLFTPVSAIVHCLREVFVFVVF